jgi:hypothetical protein
MFLLDEKLGGQLGRKLSSRRFFLVLGRRLTALRVARGRDLGEPRRRGRLLELDSHYVWLTGELVQASGSSRCRCRALGSAYRAWRRSHDACVSRGTARLIQQLRSSGANAKVRFEQKPNLFEAEEEEVLFSFCRFGFSFLGRSSSVRHRESDCRRQDEPQLGDTKTNADADGREQKKKVILTSIMIIPVSSRWRDMPRVEGHCGMTSLTDMHPVRIDMACHNRNKACGCECLHPRNPCFLPANAEPIHARSTAAV